MPQDVIDQVKAFRASSIKLTPYSMAKEVRKMDDSGSRHVALKFMYWQKFCWDTENLPIGMLNSMQMEKRSKFAARGHYLFFKLGLENISPFRTNLERAYEAPFPNPSYKMGPRAMPSHVPIIPDQSLEAQKKARDFFATSSLPFLSVLSLIHI